MNTHNREKKDDSMAEKLPVGRLLRADTTGFVVGCRVSEIHASLFGSLVRAPLGGNLQTPDYQAFGMIHDIHIDDDGLVRQLVIADNVDDAIIADNRVNRNVPVEISVITIGYQVEEQIRHLLPPRPPLSLDVIYLCGAEEIRQFTQVGHFGYFRHILRSKGLPIGELLAAHLDQANQVHQESGDKAWSRNAMQEIITLLRDDYPTLMTVLGALGDVLEQPGGRR
jgi:hypothetical protein